MPAVPEPLGRLAGVRRRRRAVRQRRRRRELQLRRLRAGRHPAQPVRRPAGAGVGGVHDAADRRRAARCAARTSARPATRPASAARSCASNPTPARRWPDNPNAGSPDPNARRIVAYGLRNPFRITVRPGTNEVWAGDVGWRHVGGDRPPAEPDRRDGRTSAGRATRATAARATTTTLNLEPLRDALRAGRRGPRAPYFTYNHQRTVVPGETCPTGGSSISGLAFYAPGGSFPAAYDGALFFADYSRNCIWVMMRRRRTALPDPANVDRPSSPRPPARSSSSSARAGTSSTSTSAAARSGASAGGDERRRRSRGATATPSSGAVPLTVTFDGRGSSDPDGDAAHVRVGPRRRRRVRRLDVGHAEPHLHHAGRGHGAPAGDRHRRPDATPTR